MKSKSLLKLLGLLLTASLCTPLFAATSVEELSQLMRQQEDLQRTREEHETSLRMLRMKDATPGALQTLEEKISSVDLQMLELRERELQLRGELAGDPANEASQLGEKPDQDTVEVQRLKILLSRYYAEEDRAKQAGAQSSGSDAAREKEEARSYEPDQVLLSGAESISALTDMNRRLFSDSVVTSQRREIDIIYHIEVRGDGSLRSSKSYSLKALGRAQYVGKVTLPPGAAQISVKTDQWTADLDTAGEGEYLVTLSTPFDSPPELHLIPVQALKDTGWKDMPDWLPYIGNSTGT